MKKLLFTTLFSLLISGAYSQGQFSFSPQKPQPGDVITIHYKPAAVVPAKIAGHEFKGLNPSELTFVAKRKDGQYTAAIQTDTAATFLYFVITAGGALDNNQGNGFTIPIYQGEKPRRNAYVAASYFYQYYGEDAGVSSDKQKAAAALKNELAFHPDNRPAKIGYLRLKLGEDADNGKKLVLAEIDAVRKVDVLQEDDYAYISQLFTVIKDKKQADATYAERKLKFPEGVWVAQEMIAKFYEEKNLKEKRALYDQVVHNIATLPQFKASHSAIPRMQSSLLRAYIVERDWEGLEEALNALNYNDQAQVASLYNNAAWELYEAGAELEKAREFASFATSFAKANWTKGEAENLPEKRLKSLKNGYAMYADTYAAVLLKMGAYEEGFPYAKDAAIAVASGNNVGYNSIYTQLAEKILPLEEYKKQAEKFVVEGKSDQTIKDVLKRAYVQQHGGDAGFEAYIVALEEEAMRKMKEEYAKKMENRPAPEFSLRNLENKEIQLADLKGKTVVVDFWATWCGPCIASFPAMQKAQEKFRDDPNVKFVFINSWEEGENVQKVVTEFIKKGGYPFEVLFDLSNKVIESYGVSGIPTKFIVDKKGNIRFTSIGFGGSADKAIDEITAMIELAAQE